MGNRDREENLISVIVPVYNGQDYLENGIRSILEQTYQELEIIIVNDGSTDRTGEVCDRLQAAHENIKVVTLGDEGVSAARNAGMDAAEGAFIAFVDADDRLHREMLARLHTCMEQTGSDVAGCRFFCWTDETDWQRAVAAGQEAGEAQVYEARHYLREAVLKGNSRCWSKLYRRGALEKVRFREGLSIGEDLLFLVQMLPFVKKIAELPWQGYGYYQNPAGAIRRGFSPSYMDQITCWELAREGIIRQDQGLAVQADAQIMVAVMLVVGKIAQLSGRERRRMRPYRRICEEKLKRYAGERGAYAYLPPGYGIKVRLFSRLPGLYVYLYHFHRR